MLKRKLDEFLDRSLRDIDEPTNVVQIRTPQLAMLSNPSGTSWTEIPLEEALELTACGRACECPDCHEFADGLRSFHLVEVMAPKNSAIQMLRSAFASLVLIALASLVTVMLWAYFAK